MRQVELESQRDSGTKPRVASRRATLGVPSETMPTLKGLRHPARHRDGSDATPLGLRLILRDAPRVGARRANPGLKDAIPLGLSEGGRVRLKVSAMQRVHCRL